MPSPVSWFGGGAAQGPFTYEALPPEDISFVPLKQTREFKASDLMQVCGGAGVSDGGDMGGGVAQRTRGDARGEGRRGKQRRGLCAAQQRARRPTRGGLARPRGPASSTRAAAPCLPHGRPPSGANAAPLSSAPLDPHPLRSTTLTTTRSSRSSFPSSRTPWCTPSSTTPTAWCSRCRPSSTARTRR